jgi:hypothetical protein
MKNLITHSFPAEACRYRSKATLAPTKPTVTAAKVAVEPNTSLGPLSLDPSAMRTPNNTVEAEVFINATRRDRQRDMIDIGVIKATPPNNAMARRRDCTSLRWCHFELVTWKAGLDIDEILVLWG